MNLNLSNITNCFCQVSGIKIEEAVKYTDYIVHGQKIIQKLISKTPDESDLPLCEYAAACVANYSYVCALLSKSEKHITPNGSFSSGKPDSALLDAARLLRDDSLMVISHLTDDCGFCFMGVSE